MNTETGQIREFPANEKPMGGSWVELKVGDVMEHRGCYFRIHRINAAANQVILTGISAREYAQIRSNRGS